MVEATPKDASTVEAAPKVPFMIDFEIVPIQTHPRNMMMVRQDIRQIIECTTEHFQITILHPPTTKNSESAIIASSLSSKRDIQYEHYEDVDFLISKNWEHDQA